MSLEDSINATNNNIISENHDFDNITPSRPSGDPMEYAPTKERAVARANLATTEDGKAAVFVTREPAWHGMGIVVYNEPNLAEALEKSGIAGRDIRKQRMYTRVNGELVYTDQYALVRGDTGQVLPGSVGKGYEVVQDEEVYQFFDAFGENVRYATGGVLGKGERSWLLAKMEDMTVKIAGGDTIESYVLFVSQHGCGSIKAIPTSLRVECNNTLNGALRTSKRAKTAGLSFRHTKNIRENMQGAFTALKSATVELQRLNRRARTLGESKIEQPIEYFRLCVDDIIDATVAGQKARGKTNAELLDLVTGITDKERQMQELRKYDRLTARRGQLLNKIIDTYHSDRYNESNAKIGGTAWAAANAVTDVLQHDPDVYRQRGTELAKRDNRFNSLISGTIAQDSENAMALAASMSVSA